MKRCYSLSHVLFLFMFMIFTLPGYVIAQDNNNDKPADKPLFHDPVYDGAADPTIIWNHPRLIIHLTSKNLINWDFKSKLELSSDRCIDACVFRLPDGTWRMYYNNEVDSKSIYYADSPDLYKWTDSGKKVIGDQAGEGPNVFFWKDKAWMVVDNWKGLGIYSSDDFVSWKRQKRNILQEPGTGTDDQVIGQHPCVVVSGDRAFIFYFTHFGQASGKQGTGDFSRTRRSCIQVAELEYEDGQIVCNRDKPVLINLKPPGKR